MLWVQRFVFHDKEARDRLPEALAPGEYQQLLYDWPIGGPKDRGIISGIEMQHRRGGIALTACYAALKSTSMIVPARGHPAPCIECDSGRHRMHANRILTVGMSLWVELPRHRRICVHIDCGTGEVDSVGHLVLTCSPHDDPRLRVLSFGSRAQLGNPASNLICGSRCSCRESSAARVMFTRCRCANLQHESGSRGPPDMKMLQSKSSCPPQHSSRYR